MFTNTVLKCGQPRAYADSLFVAEITAPATATDAEVWEYCQTLRPVKIRDDKQQHTGSCGFPYGLNPYGSLKKTTATKYLFSVTEPYCD